MNCNPQFINIVRSVNLILILLFAYPLSAQQIGTVPVITLVSPSSADSLNNSGRTLVRAEIVSYTPIKTFRIYHNGVTVGSESGIKALQKDSITYIVETLIPLIRGQNIIYVEARNSTGRADSERRVVNSQLESFVNWLLPASVNSSTKSEMLTVQAEIYTDYDLKSVSINLNGTELSGDNGRIKHLTDNSYSFEKAIQIRPGKNTIYISTSSTKGVTKSTTREVTYYQGSAPVITLVSPASADSLNNSGRTLVRAEIISYTALKTFRIYHNGEIVGSESGIKALQQDSITYIIETLIPLIRGQNIIYVEARNAIGRANSATRVVTSQLNSFVNWMMPASVNSSTKSEILTVQAAIYTDYDLENVSLNLNGAELSGDNGKIKRLTDNSYLFERTIQINPGKNTIYISTTSTNGVTKSTARVVTYYQGSSPIITLVSPSVRDSLNNSGMTLINAEIVSSTELQTVRIFHNRIGETVEKLDKQDSITYLFKRLVPLKAGENIFFIEAKNYSGTTSSEKRTITCRLEPIINWISPAKPDSTTAYGKVEIKAEIKTCLDLLSTSININGTIHKKDAFTRLNNDTYILEMTLPLSAGVNSIILFADNPKGRGYSNQRNISYMPAALSEIEWVAPNDINSITFKAELPVTAIIKSKSGIKKTRLSLNGDEHASGDRLKITRKNTLEYLYENILSLKTGSNTIELSIENEAGTIISEQRIITFTIPALPLLSWKNPISDQSVVNQASMDIRMDIKSFISLKNIVVYLNGQALDSINVLSSVKKENEDFVLEEVVSLIPGENNIYVVAWNDAGKSTSEIRNIKYIIPSKPVIKWENPETNISSFSDEKITIQANISSKTSLQNLQVFLNDKALSAEHDVSIINGQQGEYRIESTIILAQGENQIYLVVENSAGRSASETRSVNFIVPAAPAIAWLNPPTPRTNINLSSPEISATIKSFTKLQSVLVYVNGTGSEELGQISPSGTQGEYTLRKAINLQPGENNIYLSVTNSIGTTNSETRYITNPNTTPPLISWTTPSSDSAIVNSDIVVIEACIKSVTGLKSVQILVNGVQQASEMTFQAPQPGGCSYIVSKSVILKEGDNRVFIIAENFAGSNRSDKRLIRFQATLTEKRLALVIGNSDYTNSTVLKNPVNDANLMEGTLKTMGFSVIKRINATKNEMFEALRDFSKKISEYNVVLFYYAGHGVQVDGQNYLIPTDAVLKEPTDCKWEAMLVSDIVEEFERVPDNINIVILDACRNNPFRSWSRGGSQGFRIMNAVSGTLISYATGENSTSTDGLDKNGIFTEELVKQMNIPQSIYQVFNNTRKQVMKRTNNLQKPTESNNLTGDFYFKK